MKLDVAIVGAGPAGASAAILLARLGCAVKLFDRAKFPRDKACGEYLNPGAWRILLEELGIRPNQLGAHLHKIDSIRIVAAGGELCVPLRDASGNLAYGISCRRNAVDELLLRHAEAAGARIEERFNVRRALLKDGAVVGIEGTNALGEMERCEATITLACDGAHSTIARQFGWVKPIPKLAQLGVVAHFEDVDLASAGFSESEVRMFAARSRHDACVAGFSPQAGGSAILSCVLPASEASRVAGRQSEFIEDRIRALPGLKDALGNAQLSGKIVTTTCFGHRLTRTSANGLLLVGDAACFIDPFTGEGIHHALRGGVLAAYVAERALRGADVREKELSSYGRLRAELSRHYRLSELIHAIVTRPALVEPALRRLATRGGAARALIDYVSDIRPARDFLDPGTISKLARFGG